MGTQMPARRQFVVLEPAAKLQQRRGVWRTFSCQIHPKEAANRMAGAESIFDSLVI